MANARSSLDRVSLRLRQQIAMSTLMDDLVVGALASVVATMRDAGHPDVAALEHAIRAHRIATMKQTALFAAAGIDA
ncbi:hypothetical protein FMGBMHLM_2373 [Methylobacterium aerolatum]|nr:hypothetical protein FMGBMHLM_2373 [Methylobacterium aerolatum]